MVVLLKWPDKSPGAIKDYSVSWEDMLQADEEITAAEWIVPEGITEMASYVSGHVCTIWLGGGESGTVYTLMNRITTDRGLTDEKSVNLQVKQQ